MQRSSGFVLVALLSISKFALASSRVEAVGCWWLGRESMMDFELVAN